MNTRMEINALHETMLGKIKNYETVACGKLTHFECSSCDNPKDLI